MVNLLSLLNYVATRLRATYSYVPTCHAMLRANVLTCQIFLLAHVPNVHKCHGMRRANVPTCLTCLRVMQCYVPTCLHAKFSYVPTCHGMLRAHMQSYVMFCHMHLGGKGRGDFHVYLRTKSHNP